MDSPDKAILSKTQSMFTSGSVIGFDSIKAKEVSFKQGPVTSKQAGLIKHNHRVKRKPNLFARTPVQTSI